MAIKDYIAKRGTVTYPGGEFSVGPVTPSTIVALVQGRVPEVKRMFDDLKAKGLTDPESLDMTQIAIAVMGMSPDFLAEFIAQAANEPGTGSTVLTFPIGVQIDALDKILDLTFEAEGGVKKFGEALVRLIQKGQSALAMQPPAAIQ